MFEFAFGAFVSIVSIIIGVGIAASLIRVDNKKYKDDNVEV